MKASKFIVLVGGILGILSFFLPLVSVTRHGETVKVSAFQVVKGLDALVYSTLLGGSGANYASGLAVDPVGNAYVSGTTSSNRKSCRNV